MNAAEPNRQETTMANHLAGCDTRGAWICAEGCPVAAARTVPPPPKDVPIEFSVELLDLFLAQANRDRQSAYWTSEEHRGTLDAAEVWLSSLRDWLQAGGQLRPPERDAAVGVWVVYYADRSALWAYGDELRAMRKGVEASAQVRWLPEGESL